MKFLATKSRCAVVASVTAVFLMLGGALAYACTNLAALNLETTTGAAGDQIAVTGSSFAAEQPVTLHWNSVEGAELATVTPDEAGNIASSVSIPDAEPGFYVLVATQTKDGVPTYGSPARSTFQILSPSGEVPGTQPNAGAQQTAVGPSQGISTGMIALTAMLGLAGLGLFGAGFAGVARQTRRAEKPARVRSDR